MGISDAGLIAARAEGAGFADINNPVADVAEPPEIYIPLELPSRKRERERLGKPGLRSECFLCSHADERKTTIPSEDVQKIVEMLRENTGRMDMSTLAEMVADFYAEFRTKINQDLLPGETPLPIMTAATVVEHIRKHHQDPEVKQIVMLEELQELREQLLKGCIEKSSKTGHKRGNKTQIENLTKVMKLELEIQSKDVSKMTGYAPGSKVNPTIHKQGPVARSNKNLFDYWRTV